jgi:hypothetical protein
MHSYQSGAIVQYSVIVDSLSLTVNYLTEVSNKDILVAEIH